MIWFIYFIIWLFKIFFDTMWWKPHLLVFPKKHLLSGDHGERYSLPCFSKFKETLFKWGSWREIFSPMFFKIQNMSVILFFVVLKSFFFSMFLRWWGENTSFQYIKLCDKKKMINAHSFWVHHFLENVRERSMVL